MGGSRESEEFKGRKGASCSIAGAAERGYECCGGRVCISDTWHTRRLLGSSLEAAQLHEKFLRKPYRQLARVGAGELNLLANIDFFFVSLRAVPTAPSYFLLVQPQVLSHVVFFAFIAPGTCHCPPAHLSGGDSSILRQMELHLCVVRNLSMPCIPRLPMPKLSPSLLWICTPTVSHCRASSVPQTLLHSTWPR